MKNANDVLLSTEEVNAILQRAWSHTSSPNRNKPVDRLKVSDWDVLAEDIKIRCSSEEFSQYEINTFSGEAYMKLLGKPLSKKSRSIYVLVLFILIVEHKLDDKDKVHLANFLKARNHFLQKYFVSDQTNPVTTAENPNTNIKKKTASSSYVQRYWWVSLIALNGLLLMKNFAFSTTRTENSKEIIETTDERIKLKMTNKKFRFHPPCDVVFDYDFKDISYKEAFLVIYGQKIPLDASQGSYTHTFTAPGVSKVAIQLDNTIKYFDLVIRSNGWFALVDNINMPLKYKNGALHYDLKDLPAQLLEDGQLYTNYTKIHDWEVNGDDMTFEARVKNPLEEGGISCYDVAFDLVGFKDNSIAESISFNLVTLDCERYANLKVGKTAFSGQKGDNLVASTLDLSSYHDVRFETHDHCAKISVDDQVIHEFIYSGEVGDIKYIQIGFMGSGSIDWLEIKSNKSDISYRDDFNG